MLLFEPYSVVTEIPPPKKTSAAQLQGTRGRRLLASFFRPFPIVYVIMQTWNARLVLLGDESGLWCGVFGLVCPDRAISFKSELSSETKTAAH